MPALNWIAEVSLGTLTESSAGAGAFSIGVQLKTRERIAFFGIRQDTPTEIWAMEIFARINTVWGDTPIASRIFPAADINQFLEIEGPPEVRLRIINADASPVDVVSVAAGYTIDGGSIG